MKNAYFIIVVVVVLILGLGYLGRDQVQTMMMGTSPTPTASTMMTPSSPPETMMKQASQAATINNDVIRTSTDPKKGNYLTDLKGMTLYIFDKDTTKDKSNCTGGCLALWPAYTTNVGSNNLPENITTFKRADGTIQYSWKGKPLYYYTPDKKVGDVTGDGVGGVWHIIAP